MIQKNAIVIYKNQPAIVLDFEGEKFTISWCVSRATSTGKKATFAEQKVREKDITVLFSSGANEGVSFLEKILSRADALCVDEKLRAGIKEAHELLLSDEEADLIPFLELFELVCSEKPNPLDCWGVYSALSLSHEFFSHILNGAIFFKARTFEEIEAIEKKEFEKAHADELRAAFISRLKKNALLPEDSALMGDVEAFALGKTDKSRTLREAGFQETVEKAHKILLETGLWTITRNPYPLRWGLSAKSASESLPSPPKDEERVVIPGVSYAIDNAWSNDPDDAISFDGEYLWVHVADPASVVFPDSTIDKIARARGSTLYIPEGASMMLSPDCLEHYALGLTEESFALSFKIKINKDDFSVESCEVLRSIVKVKRYTYEQADTLCDTPQLAPLFEIAEKNIERRKKSGSVEISIPEVHIFVDSESKKVSIEPVPHPKSADVVREAMLLAGEGAAHFALSNRIPFPFVSQDVPAIPQEIPSGLAGQFRLRRCMRKRSVGVTPAMHAGLGLSLYAQVTSPLRRYGDLIAHEQLRSFLKKEKLIDKDELLLRVSAGEEASQAAKKAERNSRLHWTLVYLLQNPDWTGEAICVDKSRDFPIFFIPSLGMEIALPENSCELNERVRVKPSKIDIPTLSSVFSTM